MANIELDGVNKTIKVDSGDLTLDVPGDIILDGDGADVHFRDDGTGYLQIGNSSNDVLLTSLQSDKDMIFKGVDGGSLITALTLDMSAAGNATFNADVTVGGTLNASSTQIITSNTPIISFIESDQSNKQYQIGSFGGAFAVYDQSNTEFRYIIDTNGNHVFNEGSADTDFRVESNGNANMFFVDGGNDHVNVGTSTDHGAVMNIESSDNALTLCLASTDTDANVGPQLKLFRAVTGADNDVCGNIEFGAKDDAGNTEAYALIRQTILDASHGSEEGKLSFLNMEGGSQREVLTLAASEVVINEDSRDVDFRVESDGDTHALFVEGSSNNVGIGNNNPGTKLSVGDDDNGSRGTTGSLFTLSQDGSTTFNAGNVGTIFGMNIANNDETSNRTAAGITFAHRSSSSGISYVASTSTAADRSDLRFGTRGSDGINQRMHIETEGQVGIGQDAGDSRVEITQPTAGDHYPLFLKHSAGSGVVRILRGAFSGYAPDDNTSRFATFGDTSATRLDIHADGDVKNHDNSYGAISDERIKSNITDANSQWDDIKALKVRNFERKDDITQYGAGQKVQIGVVAQEVESVSPGLVKERDPTEDDIKMSSEFGALYTSADNETKDGNDAVLYTQDEVNADVYPEGHPDAGDRISTFSVGDIKIPATHSKKVGDIKSVTGEKVKGVSYSVLYMKAIKALQEAQTRIETLETKVQALEDA